MVQNWSHEGCALTGNLNAVFSPWESGLELHVFLHLFFLLDSYFPRLLDKRIEQLLYQSHEPTISVQRSGTRVTSGRNAKLSLTEQIETPERFSQKVQRKEEKNKASKNIRFPPLCLIKFFFLHCISIHLVLYMIYTQNIFNIVFHVKYKQVLNCTNTASQVPNTPCQILQIQSVN